MSFEDDVATKRLVHGPSAEITEQGWEHERELGVLAPIRVSPNETMQRTVVRYVGNGALASNDMAGVFSGSAA